MPLDSVRAISAARLSSAGHNDDVSVYSRRYSTAECPQSGPSCQPTLSVNKYTTLEDHLDNLNEKDYFVPIIRNYLLDVRNPGLLLEKRKEAFVVYWGLHTKSTSLGSGTQIISWQFKV